MRYRYPDGRIVEDRPALFFDFDLYTHVEGQHKGGYQGITRFDVEVDNVNAVAGHPEFGKRRA